MKTLLPNIKRTSSGFTLIELLLALTIIAILAVAVFVALNPAQRIKDSRDARRAVDVDQILSAIHQSIVDNKGSFPANLPTSEQQIGTDTLPAGACTAAVGTKCTAMTAGCVNLLAGTPNLANYLGAMPIDPIGGTIATAANTGYSVARSTTTGVVTVKACHTDGASAISAQR